MLTERQSVDPGVLKKRRIVSHLTLTNLFKVNYMWGNVTVF